MNITEYRTLCAQYPSLRSLFSVMEALHDNIAIVGKDGIILWVSSCFERNYGKEVEVRLYAPIKGVKSYEGVLEEHTDGYVLLSTPKGLVKIENNRIAVVRPLVKFE